MSYRRRPSAPHEVVFPDASHRRPSAAPNPASPVLYLRRELRVAVTSDAASTSRVRLDVWLDVACLFRTRSEAQRACQMGRVEVNGHHAKPHREVKPGDELSIRRPAGRRQRVVVRVVTDKHIAKPDARLLYEDITPPPTPEELELRRLAALARPQRLASNLLDKRRRRAARRVKEQAFGDD
jgi:ribosome-associated heat shock protein Hsp15